MLKLHYFDGYVRAEAIRMLLNHAKVPFEDIRYSWPDFQKLKEDKESVFKNFEFE